MSVNQDLANTQLTSRQGLIVYLNSISNQYKLRRFGDIVYSSNKLRYCILYVTQNDVEKIITILEAQDFVNCIEKTMADNINLDSKHIEQQISEMAKTAGEELEKNKDMEN
ncbi:YlbG family protein [Lactobacillus bombicola]|uniref:DUF2129 domain-containing protein n=1 Tax=Lactobacillus bombicola TaxID=1505723 RepID=A0A396T5N1_9LACO|nr:YlbG family protein [Lactobacillus bombicola]RHW54563.1 DUF2129 domain-containing protein [Lactobacillus bombicola]